MQHDKDSFPFLIPVYNPHIMDHPTQVNLLVTHGAILAKLISQVWQNIAEKAPHFTLLTGPGGCGKTHLLSVFYGRIMADETLREHSQIVWFSQHPHDIGDYTDLLLQLLERIKPPVNPDQFRHQLDALYLLNDSKLPKAAEQLLLDNLAQKPLLLLCENFKRIVDSLGTTGQRRLKTLLQNSNKISIVATSKRPLGAAKKDYPINDMFSVENLAPLSLKASVKLLTRVAQLTGKPQLAELFNSPPGKACIDALHHLAAGNARIYVAFAQWVKDDPLAEFSAVMRKILDQQTPYFQSTLRRLPAQQQKLVCFLAKQYGTTPVTDIAKSNRITQQTTSGQLKKLRDSGIVVSTAVGRTSHYEIAAPLKRLILQIQQPQSGDVQRLLDFMRHWFATREQGLSFDDGQCFVFDNAWLLQTCVPQSLPLNVRLQHVIKSYLGELEQGNNSQFERLRTKLKTVGEHIEPTPNDAMELEHTDLLYGLACHNLANNNQHNALTLCQDLYAFAENINSPGVWKHICRLTVSLTALFAMVDKVADTQPMLSTLEKLESRLHSLPFSIGLSHCLIAKAKGYALQNDKAKAQQALDQLRVRAEKRNNPEIAGAYCHGVQHTLGFIAAHDEKLAVKLFKQAEDIANKYRHSGLLFSCARALWAALPQALGLERIIEMADSVHTQDTFNREIFLILQALGHQPDAEQRVGQTLLWQKLVTLGCEAVFAAGLIQVSLSMAKQQPEIYGRWLTVCTELLEREESLQHCRQILFAVQGYLDNGCDKHQLLALPQEVRTLVLQGLS